MTSHKPLIFKELLINSENFLEINRVIDKTSNKSKQQLNNNSQRKWFHNNSSRSDCNSFQNKYRNRNDIKTEFDQNFTNKPENKQGNTFNFKCFGCGQIGHRVIDCPERKQHRNVFRKFENREPDHPGNDSQNSNQSNNSKLFINSNYNPNRNSNYYQNKKSNYQSQYQRNQTPGQNNQTKVLKYFKMQPNRSETVAQSSTEMSTEIDIDLNSKPRVLRVITRDHQN